MEMPRQPRPVTIYLTGEPEDMDAIAARIEFMLDRGLDHIQRVDYPFGRSLVWLPAAVND